MTPVAKSRYNYATVVRTLGDSGLLLEPVHHGVRPELTRVDFPDNVRVPVSAQDTWHSLAYRAYQDSDYWWAVAEFSRVSDPFAPLLPSPTFYYECGLLEDVPVGKVTNIRVSRIRGFGRGDVLKVESLAPGAETSIDVTVLSVELRASRLVVAPVAVTNHIPVTYSRVLKQHAPKRVYVTQPSMQRLLFDATDYGNPLNTV